MQLPKELLDVTTVEDLVKMYCNLRKDYVDLLKEVSFLRSRNEKLEKENSEISHELWEKNGCGYMGGS